MNETIYRFEAVLQKVPDLNGAYVEFPYDVRAEFGKGRVKGPRYFRRPAL